MSANTETPEECSCCDAQLGAILAFIDQGYDELTIRRIWEAALRAGQKERNVSDTTE